MPVIQAVLWFIAGVLLLLATIVILGNAEVVVSRMVQKKFSSRMPFFGGICGVLGILAMPLKGSAKWCWIPLIADLGSAPMLVGLVWMLLRKNPAE
jgi:hypothetical protein